MATTQIKIPLILLRLLQPKKDWDAATLHCKTRQILISPDMDLQMAGSGEILIITGDVPPAQEGQPGGTLQETTLISEIIGVDYFKSKAIIPAKGIIT